MPYFWNIDKQLVQVADEIKYANICYNLSWQILYAVHYFL